MPPSSPSHYYILREELNQKVNSFENSEFMYLGTVYQCNSTVPLDMIFHQITTFLKVHLAFVFGFQNL